MGVAAVARRRKNHALASVATQRLKIDRALGLFFICRLTRKWRFSLFVAKITVRIANGIEKRRVCCVQRDRTMGLKPRALAALRWCWFGLLVLLAFGYLAAGLSDRSRTAVEEANSATEPDSLATVHSDITDAVKRIDQVWRQSLGARGLECADAADWMTVCRRASLALIGNGLSLEEIRNLEKLPEPQREAAHLNNLLVDSRFHDYWAERWTRFLVGTDNGQFITFRRRRFRVWLSDVLAENRRYDQIVRDLITAEGLWTDHPEVNFITATFDSNDGSADPVRLAARTARCFLGLRIDCLQCHNDFLGNVNLGAIDSPREGLQSDFHQLAAFYSSAKTNGLQGVRSGDVDYQYKYLDAEEEVAVQPSVPYSPELLPDEGDPRQRLASWVTHPENRQAARAAVSHVWALMYGRPATEAVDNLPLDETSTPALEALTDDFIETGFDIRRLIRLIAASAPFRVSSRSDFEITADHEQYGAVFPLVRLRPEQVAGSIVQSARIKSVDRDSSFLVQLQKFGGMNDFINRYGDMGEDEFTTDSVTLTQRLVMLNGKMISEIINSNPFLNASAHIDMFAPGDELAVQTVYLCVLNRYPTEKEKTHFEQRLASASQRGEAIEDLFWVLLNSTEFAWNH